MEFERLSGDYNRGYTRAIQDIIDIFGYVNDNLVFHKKRWNYRLIVELLSLILRCREVFRERRNYFIRWNCVDERFECLEERRKK